ncbi:hypothetical protein GDO81_024771 [Engystomops pustulosus]|uniref:Uncharacterized protein n=1 Tax=Engystomops pustulosus TaxID=76066 RepID=A0AAV6YTH1_ENGPU|nr:hypothetical protein GDO81_024771 [Engystomops pustulosus]
MYLCCRLTFHRILIHFRTGDKMLGPVHMRSLDSGPFGGQTRNPSIKLRHVSSDAHPRSFIRRKVKEKDSILGFEVCRCLHWQHWELGKESTKNLTLKNVRLRTQKIKFR